MPTASFDNLLLYFRDSPAVGSMVSERTLNVYRRRPNSRRQLIYRIAHGLVQFFSIHSPFKGSTDISAG